MRALPLTGRLQEFGEYLITPKGIAAIIGQVALVFAAYAALRSGEILEEAQLFSVPEITLPPAPEGVDSKKTRPLESYKIIEARNLFGTTLAAPVAPPTNDNVARPKLRLVGTNVGKGEKSFAIIEDQNKNDQDIFGLNEQVFTFGRLIEVSTEFVKLQYPDRVDTLALEEGKALPASAPAGETEGEAADDEQTEFSVSESELSEALSNLPALLSQARAVPYFRNGQSIGMRLFAIRNGSLYEKLGLKNGDIITTVNENSLSDPTQALRLFEQLRSERSISVKMERNGASREARYNIR